MAHRSTRFLVITTACILIVGAVIGVVVGRHARTIGSPSIEAMAHSDFAFSYGRGAEEALWKLLQTEPPTLDRIIDLLDAHDAVRGEREKDESGPSPFLSEPQIDAFLSGSTLPPDVAQLAHYWREVLDHDVDPETAKWISAAADLDAPLPNANRLLGQEAELRDADDEAASRYLREGRFVPNHDFYIVRALTIYEEEKDWSALADAMSDPKVQALADPTLKARVAVEKNDWRHFAMWSFLESYEAPPLAPLVLSLVAALAWAVFCAQLGKAREHLFFRPFVYLAAFLLGVGSIYITDMAVLVEESKLHLVESGDPIRDALYFIFGVGFREELSKLLLFAPLLPVLRRYGTKLDVVVCGAFVGLGFAGVENIGYLASGDVSTSLGRFLSANFLHMAMTAILASAVDDFIQKGDDHAPELSRTVLLVIVLHGLYDFFISHPKIGGGYFSMMAFFILANRFLVTVERARGRSERDGSLFTTFVIGIAVVLSVSFVWASFLVGPGHAVTALSGGLLGSAILIFVFARRFREI